MFKIQNVFHCDANNIGDRMCGPAQYLWPSNYKSVPFREAEDVDRNILIGGGQIFDQTLRAVAALRARKGKAKIVVWGIGLPPFGKRIDAIGDLNANVDLLGTRDFTYKESLAFVPCASCLSPLFDVSSQPKNEVVAFLHRRKGPPISIPSSIPVMINEMRDPREVIEFLASGETVLTSSYHGVYWAQLLKRKVVCIPYGEKFRAFQHNPVFATPSDWKSCLPAAKRAPDQLEEYRAINEVFAKRAVNVWQ